MTSSRVRLHSYFPFLQGQLPWVALLEKSTPTHQLKNLEKLWDIQEFWVKREDLTAKNYGGNKVRNLEFILADAMQKKYQNLITCVPYGSNFTAALAAQAQHLGMNVYLSQFVVFKNSQVVAHADFCLKSGAEMHNFSGKSLAPLAFLHAVQRMLWGPQQISYYWIAPGASTLRGALGHTQALLEYAEQCQKGEAVLPDELIVGAGTCGTMAGILAGVKILNLNIKVIGVQAADSVICNRFRIARLANQVLQFLKSPRRVNIAEVQIEQSPANLGYGLPTPEAHQLIDLFQHEEGIPLDTTYTAKVAFYLQKQALSGAYRKRKILYWHTYSPAAYQWPGQTSPEKFKPLLPKNSLRSEGIYP